MRIPFFILLLFLISIAAPAQTDSNLDRDNGFSDIHLLSDIDSLPDFISIFKDSDIVNQKFDFAMEGSQYTYNGSKYTKFCNARISKIFLTAHMGYVTEIKVVCQNDSSVISTLTSMYGQPEVRFKTVLVDDKKAEYAMCMWQSGNVRLVFTAKKYFRKKDSDASEVPDFMYLKFMSWMR